MPRTHRRHTRMPDGAVMVDWAGDTAAGWDCSIGVGATCLVRGWIRRRRLGGFARPGFPRCRAAGSVTTVTAVLAQRRVEVTLTGDDTATVAVNGQPIVGVTAAGGGVDVWPDGQT